MNVVSKFNSRINRNIGAQGVECGDQGQVTYFANVVPVSLLL